MKKVVESIVEVAEKYPERIAYFDNRESVTYLSLAESIASYYCYLTENNIKNGDVVWNDLNCGSKFLAMTFASSMVEASVCLLESNLIKDIAKSIKFSDFVNSCLTRIDKDKKQLFIFDDKLALDLPEYVEGVSHDSLMLEKKSLLWLRKKIMAVKEVTTRIIFFTSGSTGIPKAVICRSDQFNFSSSINVTSDEQLNVITRSGCIKPFFSVEIEALQAGQTIQFLDVSDDKVLLEFCRSSMKAKHLLTNIFGINQFIKCYEEYDFSCPEISSVTIVGGALNSTHKNIVEKIFKSAMITSLYGQTEISAISIVANNEKEWQNEPFCAGSPIFFNTVKIRNEGNNLSEGEIGEIFVNSFYACEGYLNIKEEKKEAGGTGDIGYLKHGKLYFLGRKSEFVVFNNSKVFAREIEDGLSNYYGIWNIVVNVKKDIFNIYLTFKDYKKIKKDQIQKVLNNVRPGLSKICKIVLVEKIEYGKNQKPIL